MVLEYVKIVYRDVEMNTKLFYTIKFTGFVFMIVSTILFYNHLFTAAGNPKFFVTVYFNLFGEGQFELFFFTIAIPFIAFTVIAECYSIVKSTRNK